MRNRSRTELARAHAINHGIADLSFLPHIATMNASYKEGLVAVLILTFAFVINGFGCNGPFRTQPRTGHDSTTQSRNEFLSNALAVSSVGIMGWIDGVQSSLAADEAPASASRSIAACPGGQQSKPTNCVSTSSIKQVDRYAPPWTFECSIDEAFARLKGVVKVDSSLELVDEISPTYLKVIAKRPLVTDELEFVLNDKDQLVLFRSAEMANDGPSPLSDFGVNRKRLDGIRQKAAVFQVMGQGLNTADSFNPGGSARGNGPLGQLKAFYGLQSGQGFEDLFEE